jgi:hypothetical protein
MKNGEDIEQGHLDTDSGRMVSHSEAGPPLADYSCLVAKALVIDARIASVEMSLSE